MDGAIFYTTKYGSTADYARWIGEATGLPVFSVDDPDADPAAHDFLVIGSPIMYYKLALRNWLRRNVDAIRSRPTLLFTVSGAPAGVKLSGWVADSMPESPVTHMEHVALRGRWRPEDLTRLDRIGLYIGALFNRDPEARRDELQGFDYVDRDSIAPIVDWVTGMAAADGPPATTEPTPAL